MPDLNAELDALIDQFAEGDRQAARDLFSRNSAASTVLSGYKTVYDAFARGDDPTSALPAPVAPAPTPAPAPAPIAAAPAPAPAPASPTVDLAQLNTLLDARLKNVYSTPEFNSAVEARAKAIADAQIVAERPNTIGRSAEIAYQISQIQDSHRAEFNEQLDRAKFEEFFAANGAKYGNRLPDTYDAYVSDRRIQKRIDDGVAAGIAAAQTAQVPGTALPTTHNPMAPDFMSYNQQKLGQQNAAPTEDADKQSQAFAQMARGWVQ
jgi:hypothetical protein